MLQVSDAQMFQLGRQHTASASTLQLIADFHRFGPQYQVRCCLRVQCHSLVKATLRLEPGIDFQTPHAADLDDPEVLRLAAQDGRLLVSYDRKTMPAHFGRFIAAENSAGLLIVPLLL